MQYRADIDGLRGIAVLAVLLFHCGIPGVTGGYVGVDVFFVISGYVIASTLLRDLKTGQFSIRRFYERRIRRIFPALLFIFAICWVLAWILLLPSDFLDFSRSLIAAAGSVSNIYFWKFSGYFENGAELRPLLHTWSLSVEEQFYLLAPAAMWVCYRFLGKRFVLLFLPVALASLLLSIFATNTAPTANFFILPTRAWELLVGVILALGAVPAAGRATREAAAAVGAGLIAFAVFGYTKYTPFPGLAALPPCLGAALIIFSGAEGGTSIINRVLSWRPLVGIGLISYSLYLVHWPLLAFTRYASLSEPTASQIAAILVGSFALAAFSWKFIEQPVRKSNLPLLRPVMLPGGIAAMVVVMAVGTSGVIANGAPGRLPDLAEQAQTAPDQNSWKTGTCFLLDSSDLSKWDLKTCTRTSGGTEKALLWGDSFAAHYTPGLVANSVKIPLQIIQYTAAGCPPVLSYYSYARATCQKFNQNALEIVRKNGVKTVILSSRWVDLQQRGLNTIQSTIEALKGMGVDVWVIGQSPEFPANVNLIAYRNRKDASNTPSWHNAVAPGVNDRLREAAAGAHFIDPLPYLCTGEMCTYSVDKKLLYADYGHFSDLGSASAVKAYFPLVRRSETADAKDSAK
jgi:peptidoglycan/LPS O-acetylase OafA/YrhL